jgi:hypothetical protein
MIENPKPIQQPTLASLEVPPVTDATRWAVLPRIHRRWFLRVAPQLGFNRGDIHKYLLGQVLNAITGDDANAYHFLYQVEKSPEDLSHGKFEAEERLRWELETPETPSKVKEKLEKAQAVIAAANWQNPQEAQLVMITQSALVRDVRSLIAEDSDLADAAEYENDLGLKRKVGPYWIEFLNTNNLTE